MALDPNFPKLVLDPADDELLTELAYERIELASGGQITDFRPGSAAAAFVEGQTFALSELLYYLNLMPEAIAIEVFRLYGVQRSLGTQATGQLTFLLSAIATNNFVLPIGYRIPYLDTELELTSALFIPQGAQEGTVVARAVDVGTQYNAAAFDVLATNTGLALVESVFNRQPLTGGSDLESLADLVQRCQASVVARNAVITKLDYEIAAQNALGVGSRATAVPNLSSDGSTFRQNSVAVFLLDSSGRPANIASTTAVKDDLKTRVLLGTDVTAFPAVLVPIDVEVFINVASLSETVSQNVIANIQSYLRPKDYVGGKVVLHNEVNYQARIVQGVRSVDSVLLNGKALDVELLQVWYYPYARTVTVNAVEPSGATLTTYESFDDQDFAGTI